MRRVQISLRHQRAQVCHHRVKALLNDIIRWVYGHKGRLRQAPASAPRCHSNKSEYFQKLGITFGASAIFGAFSRKKGLSAQRGEFRVKNVTGSKEKKKDRGWTQIRACNL